jgi:exoribonuclease II
MLIQINQDQALKLWKSHKIIIRSKSKINDVWEKSENINNYKILAHKNDLFFVDLKREEKKIANRIIEKRMIIAIISSIIFCFGFMNFAIYTHSQLDKNLFLFTILFILSAFGFIRATDSEEINKFINNLNNEK